MRLLIQHFAEVPNWGTFGTLRMPGKVGNWECYTIERPWQNNHQNTSRIPVGMYSLGMRWSGVVRRASGGEFKRGWHVQHVVNRKYIMLHPGNVVDDVQGCIALGDSLGFVEGKWAVLNSRDTFHEFMDRMERIKQQKSAGPIVLEIRPR